MNSPKNRTPESITKTEALKALEVLRRYMADPDGSGVSVSERRRAQQITSRYVRQREQTVREEPKRLGLPAPGTPAWQQLIASDEEGARTRDSSCTSTIASSVQLIEGDTHLS